MIKSQLLSAYRLVSGIEKKICHLSENFRFFNFLNEVVISSMNKAFPTPSALLSSVPSPLIYLIDFRL